jgi:hypothetical protein
MAATHSIESSYFHSISINFNKSLKLVRDQVPYPEILEVLCWNLLRPVEVGGF